MASTVLTPTGQLIVDAIDGLSITNPKGVKGYLWDPGRSGLDRLPAAVVALPTVARVPVDEPESQLGSEDWAIQFPVTFYLDLNNSTTAAEDAVEAVEAFIAACDVGTIQAQDPTILDVKVTESQPVLDLSDQSRPLLAYECTVDLLKFV